MKSKILFQTFLISCLGIIYFTMQSKDNGYTTSGTSCGSCHGSSAKTATSVSFPGAPTTATPGQVLNLQFLTSHATYTKFGFNIFATGGTLATVSSGTKLSGGQLTHSAVMSTGTVDFKWTAPNTPGTYTIKGVGNAVNGNGSDDNNDSWNTTSIDIVVAFPASVSSIDKSNTIVAYPNPAIDNVILDGLSAGTKYVNVYNVSGQIARIPYSFNGNKCTITCSTLTQGIYFIIAEENGKLFRSTFVKY